LLLFEPVALFTFCAPYDSRALVGRRDPVMGIPTAACAAPVLVRKLG